MSSAVQAEYYITPEAYLAAERRNEQKHEYLAGVIYAMSGTTADHGRIAMNVYGGLQRQLRGKSCEVFSSDLKVRIRTGEAEFYYYPDATVDCGAPGANSLFAQEPRVIFEILSRESERIDRGEKLRNYQSLPSLQAYVIIDQFETAVTAYRRTSDGWKREFFSHMTDVLQLSAIECSLPLADIYERTTLARSADA